ncbi:MAG: hypothetical protein ACFNQA_06245, partial [Flavobacteriaceae bacterium]
SPNNLQETSVSLQKGKTTLREASVSLQKAKTTLREHSVIFYKRKPRARALGLIINSIKMNRIISSAKLIKKNNPQKENISFFKNGHLY